MVVTAMPKLKSGSIEADDYICYGWKGKSLLATFPSYIEVIPRPGTSGFEYQNSHPDMVQMKNVEDRQPLRELKREHF